MVNTFLVSPDFSISASYLDNKRLWKQILEANQILEALVDPNKGWQRHPATVMWQGHTIALKSYINAHIDEWTARGKNNNSKSKYIIDSPIIYPWWMYSDIIYYSHRANLLRKDPSYYEKFIDYIPSQYVNRGYFWPSKILPPENATIEESLHRLNSIPLEQILSPVQNYDTCASYYKNGKKCVARGRYSHDNISYCGRHIQK